MEGKHYTIDTFSVENYRSIYKKQTINFDSDIKAFYGANSSGKSNLYKAMVIFRRFITHSADPNSHGTPYEPFMLLDKAAQEPSSFSIKFHDDTGHSYEYSFSVKENLVTEEKMVDLSSSRPRLIFARSAGHNDTATRNGFGKKLFVGNEAARDDSLIITLARSTKNEYANAVYSAAKSIRYIDLSAINIFRKKAVDILQHKPNLYPQLLKLMEDADFSINSLSFNVSKITPEMLAGSPFSDDVKERILATGQNVIINTVHSIRNRDGDKIGSTVFNMAGQESLGTNNFFVLATLILDTLNDGKTLYIDEFGASTHTALCKFIIDFFKKSNKSTDAKLIINTHDAGLIKNGSLGTLNKDEIMIVEKDRFDETVITPLKQKMRRSDENINKKYTIGIYGGIPIIEEVIDE